MVFILSFRPHPAKLGLAREMQSCDDVGAVGFDEYSSGEWGDSLNLVPWTRSYPTKHSSGSFERLAGHWIGCDWQTEFGSGRINLQAMTAEQAALLGRATAGWESFQWREAARFLGQVEADAKAARRAAELARDHAIAGQFPIALGHAERACELERRYHRIPVGNHWKPPSDSEWSTALEPVTSPCSTLASHKVCQQSAATIIADLAELIAPNRTSSIIPGCGLRPIPGQSRTVLIRSVRAHRRTFCACESRCNISHVPGEINCVD